MTSTEWLGPHWRWRRGRGRRRRGRRGWKQRRHGWRGRGWWWRRDPARAVAREARVRAADPHAMTKRALTVAGPAISDGVRARPVIPCLARTIGITVARLTPADAIRVAQWKERSSHEGERGHWKLREVNDRSGDEHNHRCAHLPRAHGDPTHLVLSCFTRSFHPCRSGASPLSLSLSIE